MNDRILLGFTSFQPNLHGCEKVLTKSQDRRKLEVLHNPSVNDPSHSGIYKLHHDDELIAELILETVHESFSARA